jgi:DNA polymerase sigma
MLLISCVTHQEAEQYTLFAFGSLETKVLVRSSDTQLQVLDRNGKPTQGCKGRKTFSPQYFIQK